MLLMINTGHAQYFQLAFDNGRVDSFDSNHDLFKREICDADDQWVPLKLTGDEIQSLLPLIDDVDFFNCAYLPDYHGAYLDGAHESDDYRLGM